MPELPEVETIVRDLKKEILGRKIEDVWSDAKKLIKKPEDFEVFKKEIKGKEIKDIKRRAKYIVFILN
jgi:formamidopyrimidine-DNA glycosylase